MTDGRKGGFRKIKNEFVVKYTSYLLKNPSLQNSPMFFLEQHKKLW